MTKRRRRETSAEEFGAFARRIMRRLGERASVDEVALDQLVLMAHEAEEALRLAVVERKADGATWETIGGYLGVSKQAAQMRFGKPRPLPERVKPAS